MIKLKRVYEQPVKQDGIRILVERLWPRGVTKERAKVDHWLKEIAPSPDLRKWYGHDPEKWEEFRSRYQAELEANVQEVLKLRRLIRTNDVTFVFAASDEARNSAVVLKAFLEK